MADARIQVFLPIRRFVLLFFALFWFVPAAASAQTAKTAALRGQVTEKSTGTVLAGAQILIANDTSSFQRTAVTDANGQFALPALPPGQDYVLAAQASGFRPWRNGRFTLVSEQTLIVEVRLEIQGPEESILVSDTAPLVVSTAPEVSQIVDARRLTELPSNGRNLNRFALLDPHVRNAAGLGGDGFAASRLSINANSYRHTSYLLDGGTNHDPIFRNAPQQEVSLSAVQEFKVLTNQYSAEYGTSSAGMLVATTRQGGDRFHGEAYAFVRPSGIQATPPAVTTRLPNQLAQFGGSFGGPLLNDTTNFFLNYERTQQDRGSFVTSPTPRTFIGHGRSQIGLFRLDHALDEHNSLSIRLNGNRNTNDNSNDRVSAFTQPSAAQKSSSQSAGFQATERTVWGSAVNEVRFGTINHIPSASAALFPQVSIVRPNYSTEGGSSYSWTRLQTYQLSDQLAFQRGRHAVKIGGDVVRQRARDFSTTPFGEYRFAPGAPKPGESPTQFAQTFGTGDLRYGQTTAAVFVQDDWRPSSRLTMNLGLRYDHQSLTADGNNVAPRLGLAFDVAGDGKTIIRGGGGLFYDEYYFYITRRFALQGVNSPTATYSIPFGAPGFPEFPNSLTSPKTGATADRRDLYLPADKLLNPYSGQFSLGIQRSLGKGWTATADGIHAHTVKQMRVLDINAPAPFARTAPGQRRSGSAADATRPFQTFGGVAVRNVAVIENTGSSSYDALDLGLLRRFADRFQMEAHYVYSSALTYSMFFGEPNTGIPSDWGARDSAERGPSDFHQRHRFVAHGFIELPLKSQLSVVTTLASGLPVNPVTGVDNNGDTYLLDRPVGLGRNSFRAPMQASVDLSVAKRIPLREGIRLELRAEAFNLFNHANVIRVNNIFGDAVTPLPSFLQPLPGITNTDPARQLQFALRLSF